VNTFSYILTAFDVLLQASLVVLVIRGAREGYFTLVLYCLLQLATNILIFWLGLSLGVESTIYGYSYWITDVSLSLLRFWTLIALTLKTLEGSPLRAAARKTLTIIGVAAVILPFLVFQPFSRNWFLRTSQLLALAGAAMNLVLWTALIGSRKRDRQLLLVSAGLGLAVTGVAAGYGLIQFVPEDLRWLPDLFKGAALVAGALIWCWAFWPAARSGRIGAAPITANPNIP
jgi:hypothetical protein